MSTAIAFLISLVGFNVAVKIISLCKILGIKIENMSNSEIEELLKDKRFRKYMR